MKRFIAFVRKEIVFCIAAVCALISSFFVRPSIAYLGYIDWNTLFILFALMGVIGALRSCGVFDRIGTLLCHRFHTERGLCSVLVALCFFTSMLITNDVALLTFVPFSLAILGLVAPGWITMYTVILQTVAANLGSMLTPLGNPQNLFMFQQMKIGIFSFMGILLPYTIASGVFLAVALLFIPAKLVTVRKDRPLQDTTQKASNSLPVAESKKTLVHEILYFLLFIVCLLSVVRLVPKFVSAILVFVALLITNRKVLFSVDYMLLLTFCAFFVFTGNIAAIPGIKSLLESAVASHEFAVALASSQVISNVPATLLLHSFASDARSLVIGVNVGGLGTLVASLASLISYKLYSAAKKRLDIPSTGKYMIVFTVCNIVMLALLIALHFVLNLVK